MAVFDNESRADRLVRNFVLALVPAFMLALVYVFLGMPLLESSMFQQIDKYAFGIAAGISVPVIGVGYYMRHRDVSETAALVGTVLWALFGGLQDLFVYMICLPLGKCQLDMVLPWLDGGMKLAVANLVGLETVTMPFLIFYVIGTLLLVVVPLNVWAYRVEQDDRLLARIRR